MRGKCRKAGNAQRGTDHRLSTAFTTSLSPTSVATWQSTSTAPRRTAPTTPWQVPRQNTSNARWETASARPLTTSRGTGFFESPAWVRPAAWPEKWINQEPLQPTKPKARPGVQHGIFSEPVRTKPKTDYSWLLGKPKAFKLDYELLYEASRREALLKTQAGSQLKYEPIGCNLTLPNDSPFAIGSKPQAVTRSLFDPLDKPQTSYRSPFAPQVKPQDSYRTPFNPQSEPQSTYRTLFGFDPLPSPRNPFVPQVKPQAEPFADPQAPLIAPRQAPIRRKPQPKSSVPTRFSPRLRARAQNPPPPMA